MINHADLDHIITGGGYNAYLGWDQVGSNRTWWGIFLWRIGNWSSNEYVGYGSQTNHYYCHELDCYISPQNEITGGRVVNGIAFCGIFATGDDGWKDALILTWYISQIRCTEKRE